MARLQELLSQLSPDPVVRGRQFEDVVDLALRLDPELGPNIVRIWRWEDCPAPQGAPTPG